MKVIVATLALGSMLAATIASPVLPTKAPSKDSPAVHHVRDVQRQKLGELLTAHNHVPEPSQGLKLPGDHEAIERSSPYSNTESIRIMPDSDEMHVHPHSVSIVGRAQVETASPSITVTRTARETLRAWATSAGELSK